MLHEPLLFLQFLRGLFTPLHLPTACVDAIIYMWVVMLFLIVVSVLATKRLQKIPGGLQNFMEVVISGIENMVIDTMGEEGLPYFPLIATLAIFILVSNLLGLIPGFFPPTANINTTAACAIIVFVMTHVVGIKRHGFKYIKHFMGPVIWLAPLLFVIEVISHLSRVISLTLRLFGNMFGHELIMIIIFTLVPFLLPIPLAMMGLGVLVSIIQALVFMILAMVYIQASIEEAH